MPDDLDQIAADLADWCSAKRLEARAFDALDAWLAQQGGAVGGYTRSEITVEFSEHSLVLRANLKPEVRTRLSLSVLGGHVELGAFELYTSLAGERRWVHSELDGTWFKNSSNGGRT